MKTPETPMSDAELDAQEPDAVVALMAAKELEEIGEKSKARAIASALGELARLRMERVQITAMANEFGERCVSLQAAHAAAQRRDTERDAELAAAVADNAALRRRGRAIYDWLQYSRETAPCEEWEMRHWFADGSSVAMFIDSFAEPADQPGAALLREHERRGAEIKRLSAISEYARHDEGCNRPFSDSYPCKCGYAALVAISPLPALDAGDEANHE